MTTYAVLSTTSNHDYDFYAPITCRLWKEIVGFEPLTIVVNRNQTADRLNVVAQSCGIATIRHIPAESDIPIQHIAQVSRLLACTLPGIKDDDILMTADVDMWPLQKAYFQVMAPTLVNLYGSNIYAGSNRHPMCYVAAPASEWRRMLQPIGIDTSSMSAALASVKWNPDRLWDTDEDMLEQMISWYGGKNACSCKTRPGSRHGFMGQRVDRGRWVYDGKEADLIDAHLPRPGYGVETWARVRRLIEDYCPQAVDWADDWRQRYLAVFDK